MIAPGLHADFHKSYPSGPTVRGLLDVPATPGVTALLGSSGGGKTTILRCLAGLERPQRGVITFANEVWFDSTRRIHQPPESRRVGLLFQDYALFPHMTVERNVAFGLRRPAKAAGATVRDLLDRFQLSGLEGRYPSQISGGQQQRVALARTIASGPELLLLDEPLSALDAPTREEIRGPLKNLLSKLGIPVLLVTHDRLDALALASRIVIVENGEVVQAGSVAHVFGAPVSARVARLVGIETIVEGTVTESLNGICVARIGETVIRGAGDVPSGSRADICIRAEDVGLFAAAPGEGSAQNRWPGRVQSVVDSGGISRVTLDCGFPLTALVTRAAVETLGIKQDLLLWAVVKATAVTVLPR